ncbi:MAG: lysophospholipid acyltransferase family protein [Prevotella sp.]|nr:lysophospholipid acyltransferase family protein [Prevotella sp.]
MFNKVLYKIVYAIFYAISLLPFRALYCLSDLAYLIIYKLVGYRTKVVRKNLATAFPEKSREELRKIERSFYHWFCDYFLEAVKLLSISKEELDKRFILTNPEAVTDCFEQGQSVGTILGHYCNWEWLSCVGKDYTDKNWKVGLVYHPLYNYAFDQLFRDIRSSQQNGMPIPKKDILRYLVQYKREGTLSIFGYISDQAPKWENIHLWLPFLNHDTPVFTGAERIMRKMQNAVFYVEMTRPRRGYYTCTYRLITKEPQSLPEHEITKRFFAMLEETIRKHPEYYLWSHNRWKRTHEEFDRHYEIVNGKTVSRGKNEQDEATD